MSATVVYLDKVFVGNLMADSLILWATGKLSRIRAGFCRLLAGALLGSLYSLALFLPGTGPLLSFYVKFAISLLIVLAAFAPLPPRRLAVCLAFFYLVSFASGGTVIGFSYFLSHAGGVGQINNFTAIVNRYMWSGLLLVMAVIWAGGILLPRYFRNRQRLESAKLAVTIFFEGRGVTVRGLLDTGSSLCDPVSGEPVVVVEHGAIRDLLPGPMRDKESCSGDAIALIERMIGTPWSGRLRLIPFQSLGNERGLLLGIKPDRIEFAWDSRMRTVEKVVIGVHGRRLDAGEDYNAIINPSLLDRAIPA